MSEIKVNKISPRTACGTTTLGDSGDTFTIPAGVTITNNGTQTGFGRTGTVNWDTSNIKTSTFTAVSGNGYFVNTTGGAVTVNLPAGSAGDIVGLKDYAGTWDSNAVTLNPNGSEKIGGGNDIDPTLTSEGGAVLLVYVDGTQGWLTTAESVTTSPSGLETFVTATGGNAVVTCGNYKTHIFTAPGTFCVSQIASNTPENTVDYLVVAAGGGSTLNGGGAGAGGFRTFTSLPGTNSPLNAPSGLTITASAFPITVGAGGTSGASGGWCSRAPSPNGNPSSFSTIISAGGGGVNSQGTCSGNGKPGGSGGGGGNPAGAAGSGNTPPVSPPQGNDGGAGTSGPGSPYFGGGGGAAAAGNGGTNNNAGGAGSFIQTGFIGPTAPSYGETGPAGRYFAGGGGGSSQAPGSPYPTGDIEGGLGGGGNGAASPCNPGNAGTANTGGGAGGGNGGGAGLTGAAGGSGIVIIRYKYQ